MQYQTIQTQLTDGILQITLNRPDRLNAWTYTMHGELVDAIKSANQDDDVLAMVITGNGRGFCAGADIEAVFQAQIDGQNLAAGADPADWVALVRASKPMVAAINGPAVGLGITLILPMDYLIASTQASFSLRFVKLGIVPELASSHFLGMRMGFGKASELLLTGRTINAEEAVQAGLVDKLVEPDALLAAAHEIAKAMGNNPQASLRMIKQLLTDNFNETDCALVQQREFDALATCYASAEHKEAVDAFLHKRKPDFRAARLQEKASQQEKKGN